MVSINRRDASQDWIHKSVWGALVKGRSSSPGINRALRSSLAYPLGASFHNYFMYYLSEENRADGPTRRRRPDDPDLEQPLWMKDLASGDHQAFDAWISSLAGLSLVSLLSTSVTSTMVTRLTSAQIAICQARKEEKPGRKR